MKHVLIAIPSFEGKTPIELTAHLVALTENKSDDLRVSCAYSKRQLVDYARNEMCFIALNQAKADYVFFIDDDVIIDSSTLDKFIAHDKDIVLGVVPEKKKTGELHLFDAEDKRIDVDQITGDLIEVGSGSMSCALIKIDVIQKLFNEYIGRPFQFEKTEDEKTVSYFGEDVNFCKRARKAGFKVYCDTSSRPIHMGEPIYYQAQLCQKNQNDQ